MSKQYGLILSDKTTKGHVVSSMVATNSLFEDDSDSDGANDRPTGLKQALKRQDRLLQEKAIEEDPTVYQYDELYDNMEQKRKESKLSRKDLDKKPKYINKLLQSADRRKRENERRIERQVQKERETEGEQFKDKESFVTSSYRKKLEELKELEEQEKREEYLEAIGDVKKQGNLDGFYRHLYDQKVLYEDKVDDNVKDVVDNSGKEQENVEEKIKTKRKYRQRENVSEESDQEEEPEKKIQHLPSNLDADSDFSIDSSDSEDVPKKTNLDKETDKKIDVKESQVESVEVKEVAEDKTSDKDEEKIKEKPPKVKIDVWKKRTVGATFDEALKRYFERKSMREAGTYIRPSL